MKKIVCIFIAAVMTLSVVPVLAQYEPYEVLSNFNDGETMGVRVIADSRYPDEFVLIAAQCKGDTVYEVKTFRKEELETEKEISFPYVEDGQIKLFAWKNIGSMNPVTENYLSSLTYEEVMSLLKSVNDYWLTKNSTISTYTNPWDIAVFHTGNMQAYYMTGDEAYRNYSTLWSDAHSWQSYYYPSGSTTNADNICCYQTYIDLYNIDHDESYLEYVQQSMDTMLNSSSLSYWNWIDAFYMAGPVFTKMYKLTGDTDYLDKMYNMIKYTGENLKCYDAEAGLWFRDASYVGQTSDNGENVFWSRGDGWVYAAFARIIEDLPDGYENKGYFTDIFKAMSAALKNAQCPNGAWHESLLDEDFNPQCEESGTGFFVYGMLWGINNGYLDEAEYLSCALKGWKWLTETALQEDYSIGYVQQIGSKPTKATLTSSSTEDYAYANFVFAASELAKYLGGMQGDILPYLQKKLAGNIEVYKNGSVYRIKNGQIENSPQPFVTDNGIYNGEEYVSFEEYIADGMYLYESDGVYIISEYITPFNKTEKALVEMISLILDEGAFPEREYSDPNRIDFKVNKRDGQSIDAQIPQTTEKPSSTQATKINLSASYVTASYIAEPNNGPGNVVDGNLNTYCALDVLDIEQPEYLEFNLGGEYEINTLGLSLFRGDTRISWFSVSVSEDGENYTTVIPVSCTSAATTQIEYYAIEPVLASYVRLYGYGNDSIGLGEWFSPSEVEIYSAYTGEPDEEETDSNIDLSNTVSVNFNTTASIITESGNGPDNVNDGNFNTYCVLYVKDQTNPEYMQFDLGENMDVAYVALAFRNGTTRTSTFHISVSDDGVNYTTVVPKTVSSGSTNDYEYYPINKNARYVRVYGYSNSFNTFWFSVTEAAVLVNN